MTTPVLDLATLLLTQGARRYGDAVNQLAHALQCAAHARRDGADDDLVLAALLHDVGHLGEKGLSARDETPVRHHGEQAARLLAPYVPERLARVVEHHVIAKRYLCGVDPAYTAGLSPTSVRSLAAQGGPLTAEECRAFERQRWFAEAVAVRRWDDLAKVPNAVVPPLDVYRPLLARYALATEV
jgi:gamma-butyrobetaine dioxygenase